MIKLHQVSGKRGKGAALAFTTALFWGVLPVVIRVLVDRVDVLTIVWYRLLGAAVILALFIIRRYGFAPVFRLRGAAFPLTAVTIIGLVGNYVTYALGIKYLSPSMAVVLIQVAPMMLLLGGLIIFKERFRPPQWIGLVLLLGGQALFFNRRIGLMLAGVNNFSIRTMIMFLSALVWAAYALCQKQLLRYFPSEIVIFRVYLGGAILLLPLASPGLILKLDPIRIGLLIFCAVDTVIAYGCFSEALDHLEASRVSLAVAVTPLVTIGTAALGAALFPAYLRPEMIGGVGLAGAFLVVAGIMLASFFQSSDSSRRRES